MFKATVFPAQRDILFSIGGILPWDWLAASLPLVPAFHPPTIPLDPNGVWLSIHHMY